MAFPEYLNQKGDHAKVLGMKEIGRIVRSEMIAANPKLKSVRLLTVTMGAKSQGGTVSLD